MPLRIGYVREHFSSPLLQYADQDKGKTFTLVECPSGTGQLINRLTNDEIDVAIALTDPLISGIANGSTAYKLVGSYVSTPLNWAVITGKDSKYNSISDLRNTTLGISRHGSGSETMAYVMAFQQGWTTNDMKFKVNNDIRGLVASVNDDSSSAFMWEWFTTKPWLDKGEVRFIGAVPTPWPSWTIAAKTTAPSEELKQFLATLSTYVKDFDSEESRTEKNIPFIKQRFGYKEEDIQAWLKTVKYPEDCLKLDRKVIEDTLDVLKKAQVIKTEPEGGFKVEDFVSSNVANLV
ncbi:periplasmic binding protein-like II [Dendrothele bispora CBS 962.96]|uniref:Periplasmic binding protein-like II n=1 Tax=Dendrothele bispora (strain CBS 962.96) TaxID=1314807 RepID=A0A4S8MXW1_DENBC|nr:periplasmic binding protein-like II [Dendrothele bispora CBS 962.96]